MGITWECREADRELAARLCDGFVPDRVYDIHAHLWRRTDWQGREPAVVRAAPAEVGLEVYRECMAWLLPDRDVHGLHFAFPTVFPNDPEPCNLWVAEQIARDPLARGQFYVRPEDDPDWVRQEVKRLGFCGLKPFAGFAARPDKENAEIPEFFPETLAQVAHEEHWTVTLHLQRARSLADASNQYWIRRLCESCPGLTLILDHCARGFNPYHVLEGLPRLRDLPNLVVDTSVACQPLAALACFRNLGPERVLYGSDFYCSHLRGTNVPVANSFLWLDEGSSMWNEVAYGVEPTLVGLENLRALKTAATVAGLSDRDLENVFRDNAARLLRMRGVPPQL